MASDIELEILRGPAEGKLSVRVLRAVSGGEPTATTSFDAAAMAKDCVTLGDTILASSLSARRSNTQGEQRLIDVGERLFDALFTGDVENTYRSSIAVAKRQNEKLCVVLRVADAQLASLPWEAMYDRELSEFVCRSGPVVRHVEARYTPAPLKVDAPLRVLSVVASPLDLPPLDVEREREKFTAALGAISPAYLEVKWLMQATWDNVHDELLAGTWHVLHFIGHGGYDAERDQGIISLVGDEGRRNLVDADRLADLLNEASPTPKLVVLNACESGRTGGTDLFSSTAATLVKRGICAVAAMQFPVTDGAAIAFTRGFYSALVRGRSIDDAAQSGRIGMLGSGSLEWVTPTLHVLGDTSELFDLKPPPGIPLPLVEVPPKEDVPPGGDTPAAPVRGADPGKRSLGWFSSPDDGKRQWSPKSIAVAAALGVVVAVVAVVSTVVALRPTEVGPPPYNSAEPALFETTVIGDGGVTLRPRPRLSAFYNPSKNLPKDTTVYIVCTENSVDWVKRPYLVANHPFWTPKWAKVKTQADGADVGYISAGFTIDFEQIRAPDCS